MSCLGALIRRDQTLAAARIDLRHASRRPAASGISFAEHHAGRTEGRKEELWSHEFSKRNTLDFGIEVDMDRRIGM